jgi:hypothetical protein
MNGNKSKADTIEWLNTLQERVNIITGYEGLVFTISIWGKYKGGKVRHPKAEIVKSSYFPFLNMKMTWME